jgi:hypothetical protein
MTKCNDKNMILLLNTWEVNMDAIEKLKIITDNIKTLLPVLQNAGIDYKIQALVVKCIYKELGIDLPFDILDTEHYYGVEDIAKELGITTKLFLASINSCISEKNFSSTLVTKYVI